MFIWITFACGQEIHPDYTITDKVSHQCTPVLSQGKTGTCWSFSTTSFIESEIMRLGHGNHNLSELFQVRNIYLDKAQNYILRKGKDQFGQGALAHDVLKSIDKYGVIPHEIYNGFSISGETTYDHEQMVPLLKAMVDAAVAGKMLSKNWWKSYNAVLDVYIGKRPESFTYNNKTYTPHEYAKELGIVTENYISITSFTHHPVNSTFILEIPDNFSNGKYYNVELDELQRIVDTALKNGFTVSWDGDVGETGFNKEVGIAVLTDEETPEKVFKKYVTEKKVTPKSRQIEFERYNTTDDHLMHIVGKATDKRGKAYYKVKNSWGTEGDYNGYIYMSEAYFRMKTIAIMLHKDGITSDIKQKLEL